MPQGSVLGPTLCNFLYDGLLRLPIPDGVEIVAYADDVAVLAQVSVTSKVGEFLQEMAENLVHRLAGKHRDTTRGVENRVDIADKEKKV